MFARRQAWIGCSLVVVAWTSGSAPAIEDRADVPSAVAQAPLDLFPEPDAVYEKIDALIGQLGSDRYIERSEAERQLLAIGYEAFDQLKAAESHADPEIAARARYLTGQLQLDWTRSTDSPEVQQLLTNFGRAPEEERIQTVGQLAALEAEECLSALCLIARFDVSDAVSKRAALAVINPTVAVTDLSDPIAAIRRSEAILQELGHSRRTSAAWLRTYAQELVHPADSAAAWQQHVDEALAELDGKDRTLYGYIAIDLLQHVADVYEQLGQDERLVAMLLTMVELDDTGAAGVLRRVVERLIRTRNWEAIEQVVGQYPDRLRNEPIVMYLLAEARRQQGDLEEATELAQRAFEVSEISYLRLTIGDELDERGLYDWAEREFREVLKKEQELSDEALDAAVSLTSMLYDIERYAPAAEVAEDFVSRIEDRDEDANDRFNLIVGEQLQRIAQHFSARADYFRACHAHQQDDPVTERKYLEQALEHDPRDIDVLIAMYRLPAEDVDFRTDVVGRIEEEVKQIDTEIRDNPGNATNYNNWAWLVANTRGDYDKAVRYAHRAVEMAGQNSLPGFLDTLGRAYYAKGDYENAVRHQRRAVDLEPHTQQLRRQLDLFEKAQ